MQICNEVGQCTGCAMCYNVCPMKCIDMKKDEEGFEYPVIDEERCIHCGKCSRLCPNYKEVTIQEPKAYAVINCDEKTRMQSSSGAMFSALAEYVIENEGIVYGAVFDSDYTVCHAGVDSLEGLARIRGSKYVQSSIGKTYQEIKLLLEQQRLVYFSGTPCQIAGLKAYLDKEYANLFCQDVICHGVPSGKLWKHYLRQFEVQKEAEVTFRDKSTGWDTYSFSIKQRKFYRQYSDDNTYMRSFLQNLILRPSCYQCVHKGLNRRSDITLGDFWGVKTVCPEMYDNKGTSLVLLNTSRGVELFEKICKLKTIKVCEVAFDQALRNNPSFYESADFNEHRSIFMDNIFTNKFDKVAMKYVGESPMIRFKKRISRLLREW